MDFLTIVIIVVILAAVCTIGAGTWLLIQRHREDRAARPRKAKLERCPPGYYDELSQYKPEETKRRLKEIERSIQQRPRTHVFVVRRSCGRSSKKGGRYLI
jgi:hypothetical protein